MMLEAKGRAEKNTRRAIERILVDRGYKGHEVEDATVLISYTQGLTKHLKKALKRRQTIEPWIGHMKQDGKLNRCHLKGLIGDQIHALLVGVGHNFRLILKKLRLFYVLILGWIKHLMESDEQQNGKLNAVC